ncbi:hypothetical protein N836_31530 [Leptolyngbya sp. Heron Island J]|uniref:hypothetical protein n=1 Tax=Leptolyngbya sp. Heron Island J TaxID=1385935 RepID=UPI0003B9931D|nr:hypothetical protein [Leptolyngbya sp. Heron Island J]ESA38474.1 hypothetical protein N836_31530 [Leptolyngbya sp. Heron Island J]
MTNFTLQLTKEGYIAAFPSRMNHGASYESLPWPTPDQAIQSLTDDYDWDSQVGEAMDVIRPVIEKHGAGLIIDALLRLEEVLSDIALHEAKGALEVTQKIMDRY